MEHEDKKKTEDASKDGACIESGDALQEGTGEKALTTDEMMEIAGDPEAYGWDMMESECEDTNMDDSEVIDIEDNEDGSFTIYTKETSIYATRYEKAVTMEDAPGLQERERAYQGAAASIMHPMPKDAEQEPFGLAGSAAEARAEYNRPKPAYPSYWGQDDKPHISVDWYELDEADYEPDRAVHTAIAWGIDMGLGAKLTVEQIGATVYLQVCKYGVRRLFCFDALETAKDITKAINTEE